MMMTAAGGLLCAGLCALIGCDRRPDDGEGSGAHGGRGAASRESSRSTPQAVFLIVADTLRADRLSCYGWKKHETPHIDGLARRGVRFAWGHTVSSWTRPSMGAMLTSLYPRQLNLLEKPGPEGKRFKWLESREQVSVRIPSREKTVAEMFAEAGFATAAFVNQPTLNAATSFSRGFAEYYFPVDSITIVETHATDADRQVQSWASNAQAYVCDSALIDRFETWLPKHADKPMFVWLHLLTPHVPYDPPPEFAPEVLDTNPRRREAALYEAEVRATDALVGRILDLIERQIGLEKSAIVFTSDHGEELWDHGNYHHGHSLHQEILHVPYLVVAPSKLKPGVVTPPVRVIDIVPTMLGLVGRADLAPVGIEGVNLLDVIAGRRTEPLEVFAEGMLYGNTKRALISEQYKVVYNAFGKRVRLWNLAADPGERGEVAARFPDVSRRLGDRLFEWQQRLDADYQRRVREKPEDATAEELAREEERVFEALEVLGYIDGDEDDSGKEKEGKSEP